MNLNEVLGIMQNRIMALNEARRSAAAAGDLPRVVQIDYDITTTNITIDQLKSIINS